MAINFPNNPAVNDTFTVGGTTFTFTGVKWETSAVVEISSDTTPALGGTLEAGSHNINNVGVITATTFSGSGSGLTNIPSAQLTGALPELDGSSLTGLTGAAAATYGNATAVPQIVVNSNGKITGISNVTISGGGGGGGSSLFIKDSGSVVGSAGTIDFGTNLNVSGISAGVVTVTAGINTAHVRSETLSVSGVTTVAKFKSIGFTTFTSRVIFDEILEFRGLESGGSNTLDWYDSGGVVKHSIVYNGTTFNIGGGEILEIDASDSAVISSAGVGIATVTENGLNVTGVCTATSFDGDGSLITNVGGTIPSGGIILWSGAANAIPTGWYLCDGQNSTPDLRNRFVVGAGDAYAVDATGGSADATLVSHTHGSGNLGTGNAGSHSHSGGTNNTGGHSHSGNTGNSGNHHHGGGNYQTSTTGAHAHRWGTDDAIGAQGGNNNPDANGGQNWRAWTDTQGDHSHNVNGNSQSEGDHSHNINTNNSGDHSHNINTNNAGDHSHNVSGDTGSSGSSATGANLPPYYALCYIMKS